MSTGHLPSPEFIAASVAEAHARRKTNSEGKNSEVYPALSRVPNELFDVCLVGASGRLYAAGDTEFSIMSVSKPFVFALVCQELGAERARGSEQTPRGCRSTHSPPSNEAKTGEPTQWWMQGRSQRAQRRRRTGAVSTTLILVA